MLGGIDPAALDGSRARPGRGSTRSATTRSYDYDPLWRRCEELGVAPTFHSGGQGWGTRMSTTNNSTTRSATSRAADEGTCRSLVFGGVPRRFPNLRFAFQEGGVGWAAALLAECSATGRSAASTPSSTTTRPASTGTLLRRLFDELRDRRHRGPARPARRRTRMLSEPDELACDVDEFARVAASRVSTTCSTLHRPILLRLRSRRSDERPGVHAGLNPAERQLPAVFASDVGHWDVRDMRGVLARGVRAGRGRAVNEASSGPSSSRTRSACWAGANPDFFPAPSWSRPWRRRSVPADRCRGCASSTSPRRTRDRSPPRARRPGRRRDQGRGPGRGDLMREMGSSHGGALRDLQHAQSQQALARARSRPAARARAAAAAERARRRLGPELPARRRRAMGLGEAAWPRRTRSGVRLDQRLRRGGALRVAPRYGW